MSIAEEVRALSAVPILANVDVGKLKLLALGKNIRIEFLYDYIMLFFMLN